MVQETQYKEPKRTTEGQSYIIELVVMGKSVRVPAGSIYSIEGLIGIGAIVVATNFPNVSGFNILSADGETLLHEVHPTPLLMHAAPIIQQITGQQPLKLAVPVVASVKPEEFDKMVQDAKARGRMIQG
jgi:hypothetical protein